MSEPDDFTAYAYLADELIGQASKSQLADVARLLALNIGWYRQRFGEVPQEELLRMVRADTLGDDGKRLFLHGMRNLVSALADVMGIGEDGEGEARH